MIIEIELKQRYGKWDIVPMNEAAKTLAEIAGTTTLTPITCVRAKRLGAEFRFSAPRHYEVFNELLGDGRVTRFA